ncbi:polyketide cyclase, partial [Streptomyces sp. SID5475]|nr:polyketide cyclase [Streptomyces sp. SID5475]
MDPHHYRFRSLWTLDAPPGAVYAVLERPEEYPLWWPQVREAERTPSGAGRARFRSVLPYDLVVTARESRRDPAAG